MINESVLIPKYMEILHMNSLLSTALRHLNNFFDITKEYGLCNLLIPSLIIKNYIIIPEVKLMNKQPDLIALSLDVVMGKYINKHFPPPVLIIEAKTILNQGYLKQICEYADLYGHIFLLTTRYSLENLQKKSEIHIWKSLMNLFRSGKLSFIIIGRLEGTFASSIFYIINPGIDNTIHQSVRKVLGELQRELHALCRQYREVLEKSKSYFLNELKGRLIVRASEIEKALRKSKLIAATKSRDLYSLYQSGKGHILALLTCTSAALLSPASRNYKLPHIYLLFGAFMNTININFQDI